MRCGADARVERIEARRWASATFVGARHSVTLSGPPGDAMLRWLSALPEAEFALRGHLVADLVVVRRVHDDCHFIAEIEVLTVEEG